MCCVLNSLELEKKVIPQYCWNCRCISKNKTAFRFHLFSVIWRSEGSVLTWSLYQTRERYALICRRGYVCHSNVHTVLFLCFVSLYHHLSRSLLFIYPHSAVLIYCCIGPGANQGILMDMSEALNCFSQSKTSNQSVQCTLKHKLNKCLV